MRQFPIRIGGAVLAAALAWSPAVAEDDLIPAPVQASVRAAVDDGGRVGVVIGYHRDGRSAFYAYGSTAVEGGRPVDPDTIFEVGSVTKLFTAETLAAMVVAGEVALDTTLAEIWPERRSGGGITLGDLATHRAGLPRDIPAEALIGNDEAALLAALDSSSSDADIDYSNAGMAILARALVRRTGEPTATLVERRVSRPMGLDSTGYAPLDTARLARAHVGGADISDTRPQTADIARGAGGLHTTARDLMRFLEQHMDRRPGRSGEIVDVALSGDDGVPLGWQVHEQDGRRIFHHSGEANGYQAFVGFHDAEGGVAVVLLTNASEDDGLQAIALHLLDPAVALPAFAPRPGPAALGAVDGYPGVYVIEGMESGNRIAFVDLGASLGYVETTPDGELVRRARLEQSAPGAFRLPGTPVRIQFEDGGRVRMTVGEQILHLIPQD
jgi:serine-type D-Ala-D-Ala carboxypeptidase/endopeptidase